jgi:hypothetical protein
VQRPGKTPTACDNSYVGNPTESTHDRLDRSPIPTPSRPPRAAGRNRARGARAPGRGASIDLAPRRKRRCTLAARALRCGAMSAAFVLIIVVALLCVALLALFGVLWAALHFGVGEDEDD